MNARQRRIRLLYSSETRLIQQGIARRELVEDICARHGIDLDFGYEVIEAMDELRTEEFEALERERKIVAAAAEAERTRQRWEQTFLEAS